MATQSLEATRSALFDVQVGLGAVFTTWNGYYVADHFGHPTEEYWAVRLGAGIIDMSALQKFEVFGPDAIRCLNRVLTRDVAQAGDGQALYSPLCNHDGEAVHVSGRQRNRVKRARCQPAGLGFRRPDS